MDDVIDGYDCDPQPDVWPLRRGDTLANHDWFPFHSHRFLASSFVTTALMEQRRGDIGTAVILWSESMRQDPAGTLPDCDIELASLARFSTVGDWLAVKDGVMRGWVTVLVEDGRLGQTIKRLGHPSFMQGVVEQMHKRKRGRDQARVAQGLAVKKSRIRKKMLELRIGEHVVSDDRAVSALADYFKSSDLYITPDNVRTAMIEVLGFSGEVARFPTRKDI